jgi:ABC-type antimicrobial peptide transport system permease subunit
MWQRSSRTLLTLLAIAITVGSITALEGVVRGAGSALGRIATGSNAEIMVRQAEISSTSMSWVDEQVGDRISVLPGVSNVSGIIFSIISLPETGQLFLLQGYAPNSYAIQRIRIVEGQGLSSNRQIILGRLISETVNKKPGQTIDLGGRRFQVVGIFETGVSWEEMGGVITIRDAQVSVGQHRKVSMFAVKISDSEYADEVVARINERTPEVIAGLTGEFVEQLPDMKYTAMLLNGISLLAIFIGGMVVMNTMLMSVMERTHEIGVLKALGWSGIRIMGMIMQESALFGVLGAGFGIGIALFLTQQLNWIPMVGPAMVPLWGWDIFLRAFLIALILGIIGGLFPAYKATTLQPIEALRYE